MNFLITVFMNFVVPKRNYFIAGAMFLAIGAGAYGSGFMQGIDHQKTYDQSQLRTQTAATITEVVKQNDAAQVQRVEVKVRDIAREQQLEAQLAAIQTKNVTLQSILNAKPAVASVPCYLSLRDLGLLNAARSSPASSDSTGLPDPASGFVDQGTASSTISCDALVADGIDTASKYNALKAKDDSLIDWVMRELIDPMQSRLTNKKSSLTN